MRRISVLESKFTEETSINYCMGHTGVLDNTFVEDLFVKKSIRRTSILENKFMEEKISINCTKYTGVLEHTFTLDDAFIINSTRSTRWLAADTLLEDNQSKVPWDTLLS